MSSSEVLYAKLSEPFPDEMHKTVRKGGATLEYLPVSEIVTRLNRVIGVDRWSMEVINVARDQLDPDYVVAHVRLMVFFNGYEHPPIIRDGLGGQKINRTKAGDIVDLGDDFKGAVSDGIKKAATSLGVGLYLSRSDDAIEVDEAQHASPPRQEQTNPQAEVSAELASAWQDFISQSRTLDEDGKKALGEFWKEYSGGKEKPTRETATLEDLEALSTEVVRLTFGGDFETE